MHSRVITLSSGHSLLALGGELDLGMRSLVQNDVTDALNRSPHLIIDLGAVTFLDSTILSVLAWGHRRAIERGGEITLVDVPPAVHKLMVLTRRDRVLTIRRTVADVVNDSPSGRAERSGR